MDRDFLKDNLSAYLDGELAPKQMREFERDIELYPDLFAELQTLQRLNKLALDSQVPLPDDRYFDKLAGQIDAQIKRESPQDRGKVINFLLERRKTVAIISSVAAVFLVAMIGMNLFGPSAKRYPQDIRNQEIRNIELKPAIIEKPKTDTVTIWPEHEKQIVPPPIVDDEIKRDSVARKQPKHKTAVKKDTVVRGLDTIAVLKPNTLTLSSIEMPKADTVKREDQIVIVEREIQTAPQTSKNAEPRKLKQNALSESTKLAPSVSQDAAVSGAAMDNYMSTSEPRLDSITIRTETIIPGMTDARYPMLKDSELKSIQPDTAQFHSATGLSWDIYIKEFESLNQGVYRSWRLTALAISRDSLQTWVDSTYTVGPSLWYAEQAYRSLQKPNITWDDYQLWRAYIDHYLSGSPDADRTLWNQHLTRINEIYERFLGKQIQR